MSARVSNIQVQPTGAKLFAAVGVRQIMLELGPRFERATGHKLDMVFDSTGLIVRRIAAGEEFDIVLINRSAMEKLTDWGKVIASSISDVARSLAAAAVRKGAPKPDVSTVESFKHALLSAKSIARPSPVVGGSSGDHIVSILKQLEIVDEVAAKSVINGDPADMSAAPGYMVANGRAELALHQLQELMAVPGIEIAGPFPAELGGAFTFSAALAARPRHGLIGEALIDFLHTPEAIALIRAKGMQPADT
jgi:molybdate transport system substrate-binding protein